MDRVSKKETDEREFKFKPIGILRTPYQSKSGVPIQGVFDPDSRGTAEIFKAFEAGLKDVEGFSHIILIYVFHRSEGYDLVCRPYMEDQLHGVFATRAPRRPNPVGFSIVRLLKREGRVLHLAEVDMLDGTPVLDIKPFSPTFDHREGVRIGWMEAALRHGKSPRISDDRF
jgi:tRNA-Thr(GGU) m(6)t(6)A37 methyltransferase TsaA